MRPDTAADEDFEFSMGEFTAKFRGDHFYASNHMWAKPIEGRWRFGLTPYAVRLLQDVYFLDWIVEPSTAVRRRQMIGSIESKKAESDLYAPVQGSIVALNDEALDDPSIINAHIYDDAWLFEMATTDPDSDDVLMRPDAYREHLAQAWVVAQRTIKGQAGAI